MRLYQLLQGVPVLRCAADWKTEITSVSYDSHTVTPGALFAAVPGLKTDGQTYIDQAVARGAAAVLCRKEPDYPGPWVVTGYPRRALALLSANWFGHPGRSLRLIGVTGTNGKTTSTHLLKHLLERVTGEKVGLIGTNYSRIGREVLPASRTTPESWEVQRLLRQMADGGCCWAVMEVSSHALVLERVAGLRFEAGLFTNLTQDHLDFHGAMDTYRAAKGLLFPRSARGIVNIDDPAGRFYQANMPCPCLTYGVDHKGDLTGRNIRLKEDRVFFTAWDGRESAPVTLPIPGRFSVSTALGALACGQRRGLPLAELAAALEDSPGVPGRMEVVPVPADYTALIDYAHTPDALEKVLTTLRDTTKGRVICLFGCGGDRDKGKRPRMGEIAARLADVTVLTSDNPRSEEPMAILEDILQGMGEKQPEVLEPDRKTAIAAALTLARPGDTVLLAGKGHETYQERQGTRFPLDERQVVADFFGIGKKSR